MLSRADTALNQFPPPSCLATQEKAGTGLLQMSHHHRMDHAEDTPMDTHDMPLAAPENLSQRLALAASTLGPIGHIRKAPGTWGALAAALSAPLLFLPLSLPLRLLALVALFHLGSMAAGSAEKSLGRKDPGEVIIDEWLGQWVVFLPFTVLPWWQIVIGFAAFRFFDILKPWPIRASESWLAQGYGVMLDDVIAGGYAAVVLAGISFAL